MATKDLNTIELREGEFRDVTDVVSGRSVEAIALEINVIKERAARDLLSAAVDVGRLLCEANIGFHEFVDIIIPLRISNGSP